MSRVLLESEGSAVKVRMIATAHGRKGELSLLTPRCLIDIEVGGPLFMAMTPFASSMPDG